MLPEDKSSELSRPEKPESISTKGQSAQVDAFRIKVPGKLRSDFDISQTDDPADLPIRISLHSELTPTRVRAYGLRPPIGLYRPKVVTEY